MCGSIKAEKGVARKRYGGVYTSHVKVTRGEVPEGVEGQGQKKHLSSFFVVLAEGTSASVTIVGVTPVTSASHEAEGLAAMAE